MMDRPPCRHRCIVDVFDDHILLVILEKLQDPADRHNWSLVCKHFLRLAALGRKSAQLMRAEVIPSLLKRCSYLEHLDLSFCLQVTDVSLLHVAQLAGKHLRSINLSKVGTFTDVGLAVLARGCVSLAELDLSHCHQVKDLGAMAIAQLTTLRSLALAECVKVTDAGLSCIATGCTGLLSLSLKLCSGISDVSLSIIGAKCKELRSLNLSYTQITNTGLASITSLQFLEDLSLVACPYVDDEGLIYLKNGGKSLKTLDISGCRFVSHRGIMWLAKGSVPLQQLTLSYCQPITDALLKSIQKFEGLLSIRFDGCDVRAADLACVGEGCKALKELSLSRCKGVTDAGISAAVAGCRGLSKLDLTCCRKLTDIALSSISTFCTGLVSLKMEACSRVTEDGLTRLGDGCHLLEELDFTDSTLNDKGLKSLAKCTALQVMKLGLCFNISDEGLDHLAHGCCKLKELDVYRSVGIGDAGVASIASSCPRLETLNLSYCTAITDVALQSIAQLHELRNLEIRGCTMVSSLGISAVAKGCRRLQEFNVKQCTFVDDSAVLALILSCLNLRQVETGHSRVSMLWLSA